MADEYEFYVQASVRGYHAYFVDATVYIGEVMDCEMELEKTMTDTLCSGRKE